jgi:fluoride exporter
MAQNEMSMLDARLLGAVSAGGVLGALARYGLQLAFPHGAAAFGWATFGINVAGCLLIGVVVAGVTSSERVHRLARPFLVTGVLGGFTTFSTYIVDIQRALVAGAPRTALLYGAATLVVALAAAWAGVRTGEAVFARLGAPAMMMPAAAEPSADAPPPDAAEPPDAALAPDAVESTADADADAEDGGEVA